MPKSFSAKPSAIKWAKGLSIFQVVIGVLACVFFIWIFNTSSTDPFILGMQQGVADGLGEDLMYLTSTEGTGFIVGIFVAALLAPAFALLAIQRRSKAWAIASLVIYGASLIYSFSPLSLAIMILMLVKPSREYLQLSK